jgi:hypothetical protein
LRDALDCREEETALHVESLRLEVTKRTPSAKASYYSRVVTPRTK